MEAYDHQSIEKKWQKEWAEESAHNATVPKKKQYILDMFPYPSGSGLHVGHPRGYIGSDVVARMKRSMGYDVLHPMGWDAFGLPAENYAIQTGTPPKQTTEKSIERFKSQLQSIGLSYDWSRELSTADPDYYRWTQWLFLKLFEHDLAYQKEAPVNWCLKCQTVLANEQVVSGKCERCGHDVIQKNLKQWFFRITKYADELIEELDGLDWPESTKQMQRNWIGRSEGVEVDFTVVDSDHIITVFTTRIDTIYGGTFIVLAPDHGLIDRLITDSQRWEIEEYIESTKTKTQLERLSAETKDVTGAFTGSYAINPVNQEKLPIWIADFVLKEYGYGAVFADAHDERDFQFAKKYDIPLKATIRPTDGTDPRAVKNLEVCYTGDGILYDSGTFSDLSSEQARRAIALWLVSHGAGRPTTTYKLRDWLVSRQRYWGPPIPMIYCERCGIHPVDDSALPVLLATDVDFKPTGESPLVNSEEFHDVECPGCHGAARRESDTLDTFVDSSWYFLRFTDSQNSKQPFSMESVKQWMPVDLYVGGAEHSVLHLLYARFITKALRDMGFVDVNEPFAKLRHQGLIIAEDGRKMSKSFGNVVNPDDIIERYGADTLRCYEMFMGPFTDSMPWSARSVVGVRRWLDRLWNLRELVGDSDEDDSELLSQLEQAVEKVSSDIESEKFNTVVSTLMELSKTLKQQSRISQDTFHRFLQLLAPLAPHIAQELFGITGGSGLLDDQPWPKPRKERIQIETIDLPIQINGKVRGTVNVSPDITEDQLVQILAKDERLSKLLDGQEIEKKIYVQGKILNLLTRKQ